MAQNPRGRKSNDGRGKNLILVSNNSELFSEIPPAMLFPRSSSRHHPPVEYTQRISSNLFQNFHEPQRVGREGRQGREGRGRAEEVVAVDPAQRYAQECLQYQKYSFDERVRLIIHRMSVICYHTFRDRNDHLFLTFFIERLLCALAKKLLLNKFELLFLEYIFEETKWRYDLEAFSVWGHEFKSFVHIYESENPNGLIRNLQIYLLFCAYYSKKSLNETPADASLHVFLKTVSEKFKQRYQEWTELSGVTKIRINPKVLNVIHRKLTSFQEKEKEYFENYNLIVEEILEISPAYNADKEKKGRKKRKVEEEQRERESNHVAETRNLRSIIPEESPPEFPTIAFRRKQTSYMSNVDALDPMAYYNRNN